MAVSRVNWSGDAMPVDLAGLCGRHFRYRDLIECGETWRSLAAVGEPVDNTPRSPGTLEAMRALCSALLDPMTVAFDRVELTYGFASPALTRLIRSRIAPALDQHVGLECDRNGALICARRGLAVDVTVPGVGSHEAARWVAEHVNFDRMYLYGDDRPIHVSVSPVPSRIVVEMRRSPSGRRVPRQLRVEDLRTLDSQRRG